MCGLLNTFRRINILKTDFKNKPDLKELGKTNFYFMLKGEQTQREYHSDSNEEVLFAYQVQILMKSKTEPKLTSRT